MSVVQGAQPMRLSDLPDAKRKEYDGAVEASLNRVSSDQIFHLVDRLLKPPNSPTARPLGEVVCCLCAQGFERGILWGTPLCIGTSPRVRGTQTRKSCCCCDSRAASFGDAVKLVQIPIEKGEGRVMGERSSDSFCSPLPGAEAEWGRLAGDSLRTRKGL